MHADCLLRLTAAYINLVCSVCSAVCAIVTAFCNQLFCFACAGCWDTNDLKVPCSNVRPPAILNAVLGGVTILASLQGQVLNQTSAWWMRHTTHITPNALLALPDPNVAIMKKCQVLPIEFVVRGFMTGASPMLHA